MKRLYPFLLASLFSITISLAQNTPTPAKKIKVFVIATSDKNHSPMVTKAIPMFQKWQRTTILKFT